MSKYFLKTGLILMLTSIFIPSCQKDDKVGGTATEKISGEWWIRLSVDGSLIDPGYFKILTYNTSENVPTKIWLDDEENLWPFKFKADVDPANLTFSATDATSEYSDITVKVNNGKVLQGVTKGPVSLAVTDSIYFEAEFSDDPGTVYQLAGYRRTRFDGDDHN